MDQVPSHLMHEDQVMMTLSGSLGRPKRLVSCRSGTARYRAGNPGTQRCRSTLPDEARVQEAWTLDKSVREGLRRFSGLDAEINLQILSRSRVTENRPKSVTSSFAAFWGTLNVNGAWPSVFGSDAHGNLVFRRGPWEDWPRRGARFDEIDPSLPMVLSPYCGTLFHEAVGHALEADYLKRSPLKYRFGEQVSHEQLTIADRPDLTGYAGSMTHDDAGRPVGATTMLYRGYLVGDLAGNKGALRRASYRELPQVRAGNFIIKAGAGSVGDWLQYLPECYYVAWIKTGSWQPGTNQIQAMTGPVFQLEHGHVIARRDRIRLRLTTSDFLNRIDGVGDDFAMDPAVHWCVKKNQAVPFAMGAPSIMVRGASS
ncbi:MAG: metallopeptidase TldD-related protein [Acidobacteriota bacterium]|nr:metallopeptidase TldD-related protein [Acidobacteriota bacterium]